MFHVGHLSEKFVCGFIAGYQPHNTFLCLFDSTPTASRINHKLRFVAQMQRERQGLFQPLNTDSHLKDGFMLADACMIAACILR